MSYFDMHGNEIKAGMFLRLEGGLVEKIYATVDAFGTPDLGINASNDAYLKRNGLGEYHREFYPLSNFSLRNAEVLQPELQRDKILPTTYVAQLPAEIQEHIRTEITTALTAESACTEENIRRAMDSRLCDLEELLEISEYTGTNQGMVMMP